MSKVLWNLALIAINLSTIGCSSSKSWEESLALDAMLFEPVVLGLMEDSISGELQIDPHPLREHPVLRSYYLIPGSPEADSVDQPLKRTSEQWMEVAELRQQVLSEYSIRVAEWLPDSGCPGVFVVAAMTEAERAKLECPGKEFRVAWIALPRAGVFSLPGTEEYRGRRVNSIRVIIKTFTAKGQVETHSDYIFEFIDRKWLLQERRLLLTRD